MNPKRVRASALCRTQDYRTQDLTATRQWRRALLDEAAVPKTVAEFPTFAKEAVRLLGEQSHGQRIEFPGLNPKAGVVIPGSGACGNFGGLFLGGGKAAGQEWSAISMTKAFPFSRWGFMPRTRRPKSPARA